MLLSMKDFQGALDVLDSAIELNPILPAAYLNRGRAYRNLDNIEAAKTDLSRAAELASYTGALNVQIDATYELGQLFLETRAINNAIQKFNEVVNLDRASPLGYLRLGQAYLAARNFNWAVFNLTTAREILESDPHTERSPDLAQAYSDLGQAFYGLDQAADALYSAGRAMDLGDQRPINYKVKGLSHLKLKEPDKAIENLKIYLVKAPEAPDAATIQQVIDRLTAPPETK
jgi:tetratricopeptide (TPR) repeat protein